ncbi:MazG nucleotide pyrophosphohydrolase domain-containing protein [Exiguobacterium mexicanum]|uniref:MazG nucleotide pyrophosphohydrolase domain-containing protein n=1 Tax=Exiguobacterium mexicanum TaxID=340146 RepID=A0ABT7MNG3_9BACL|nr:MazG nucleotide pyrophosphohydrolase domain-containing protein [Exiguobacterium mexicanum]MDL5376737.1 MazG nucleotide pyrophosphohydrolase domain-containing protein [Exiguobacterium mexicanum]
MKELQRRIDQMIIHLGGYWRPLSGLARLLEEVGEVGGALYANDQSALREELMDVFVISTCLANQYAITLQRQEAGNGQEAQDKTYYRLVREAGEVGRILNAYEGDKKLKASATPGSLQRHIEAVQRAVLDLASQNDFDLYAAIGSLIEDKSSRDFGRFDHTPDPITEASVRAYVAYVEGRYWGGVAAKPFEEASRYREREGHLTRFLKIAEVEGLDGFVIQQPDPSFLIEHSIKGDFGIPSSFTVEMEDNEAGTFVVIRKM